MRSIGRLTVPCAVVLCGAALAGCAERSGSDDAASATAEGAAPAGTAAALPACDPDNGGITLPEGFCAVVVHDDVAPGEPRGRHIVVAPNGDVYVATQGRRAAGAPGSAGGIVALRDTDGDGRADQRESFGPEGGTGLELRDGHLYFATNAAVLRYRVGDALVPAGPPDTLVHSLPDQHSHNAKTLALGPDGALFVNVGSPTNACQPIGQDRRPGVKGEDPCRQLDTRAGVWRFDAARTGQTQSDGERWATGVRNAVALAVHPSDGALYAAQHGRDQLDQWPGFTAEDNAERPAEELQRLERGSDFGWPYCYYDTRLRKRVLAPEYGGDGTQVGRCADKAAPQAIFPGHWAPNDLLFYTGTQFPERFRGGLFVAFHGSWNRAPLPQAGYRVSFVPWGANGPAGEHETFADGFAGATPAPDAAHRPTGLAQGPDGSLYIADSNGGRVWRVMYRGGR